jgi:filamentous hemagglutinin
VRIGSNYRNATPDEIARAGGVSGGIGGGGTVQGIDGIWDQTRYTPFQRGNAIEDYLANTDYIGWTRVGSQNNGFSPAWDFNQGAIWVSLKTVDTTGSGWLPVMRAHINELQTWTSSNPNALRVLDIRVQPGGAAAAQPLINYGVTRGVQVRINEF